MSQSMSIQAILSAVDTNFSSTMRNAEQAVSGLGGVTNTATKQNKGFIGGMKSVASGMGVYKIASAGIRAVSNSMGAATQRFDTMNRFPKMMEMMGYSALDAENSIEKLNDGVIGLPTALDTVVGTTQQLALMTGDLDRATDITLGLNNAFIASGASTADASRGLTQFTQMLARGDVDLQSWNTLLETMSPALRQVADSFGLPQDDAYALYNALKSGEITFDDFTDRIIELSEATGGFADQAQGMTDGIETAMANVDNAVIRGMEGLERAVDEGLKALTGKGIADWIQSFGQGVTKAFKMAEKGATGFFNFLNRFKPAFNEIGRVARSALGKVATFFKPVGTFMNEIGASISVFSDLLTTTIGQISRGDWAGAWDSLTSNIAGRFRSVSNQFRIMVADMWTNFKGLVDRFNNIDWSAVWEGLDNFFGVIGDEILKIDFKLVGQEIGTVVRDLIETNLPKWVEFRQEVLLNPDSKLNMDAKEFHDQIMALFDGFLEGALNVVIPAPLFSWELWDKAIADASQRMNKSIMDLISRARMLLKAWEDPRIETDVMLDILIRRGEGWSEEDIEAWIDDNYYPGAYEAQIDVMPNLNIEEIDPTMMSSQIQMWFGDKAIEVTQDVIADIEVYEGQGFSEDRIEQLIDDRYGKGFYRFATSVRADIEELELSGLSELEIAQRIDDKYGKGTYELITGIDVTTQLENIEGVSAEDIQSEIQSIVDNQEMTVDTKVAMIIDIMEGAGVEASEIEAYIDSQFPPGAYEKVMQVIAQIETALQMGMSEAEIKQRIDDFYGEGTYESIVNVGIIPNLSLVTSGHSGGASMAGAVGISGQIENLVQAMVPQAPVPMTIPIAPQLTTGGAGGVEGDGFDLSGITAQIEAELESLKATVSSALDSITSTITSKASSWGTSISEAMTTMLTSVVATMTAMSLAITLALTLLTVGVTMAMTNLSTSVTTTMTEMAETVATTMSEMAETVAQAMSDMAEAITEAMNAMVEAVTAGMDEAVAVVEAGVSSIVEAVSGLYDSMYDAGKSAGQGLADGLSAMEGSVRAAASALASAANIAAQSAFIINSPSKVWRGFGYSAGEGLIDGFDGSQRAVKKSATRLAVAGLPSIAPFSGRSSHVSVSGSVSNAQQNAELKAELSQIKEAIKEGQVIMLDGNTWVGATVDRIDTALGNNQSLGGRHQLS